MAPKRKTLLRKISLWIMLAGALIAISPLLSILIFGALQRDFESQAPALWALIATVPYGGMIALVGLVLLVVSIIRERKEPRP